MYILCIYVQVQNKLTKLQISSFRTGVFSKRCLWNWWKFKFLYFQINYVWSEMVVYKPSLKEKYKLSELGTSWFTIFGKKIQFSCDYSQKILIIWQKYSKIEDFRALFKINSKFEIIQNQNQVMSLLTNFAYSFLRKFEKDEQTAAFCRYFRINLPNSDPTISFYEKCDIESVLQFFKVHYNFVIFIECFTLKRPWNSEHFFVGKLKCLKCL